MKDLFPTTGTFEVPGRNGLLRVVPGIRYRYDVDKTRCPNCGGIGLPWAGWFHCDGKCEGIAWIETGEFMQPAVT